MENGCSRRPQEELPPSSFCKPPSIHLPHITHPNDAYHKAIHVSRHLRGWHGRSLHELLGVGVEGKKLKFSEER